MDRRNRKYYLVRLPYSHNKTEDKPWLDCRFTAMLPIKFEIKQCLELKEMEVIKI